MASLMHSISKSLSVTYTARKTLPILYYLRHVKYSEASTSTSSDSSEETILLPKEEAVLTEEELAEKRDISRLKPGYRNVLYGKPSYTEPRREIEKSLTIQRSLYGKYGNESNVNPAICFMTKEEMEDLKEYERVAHTEHILELRKRKLAELEEEKRQYQIREKHYEKMMATVDSYKEKIREKILKRLSEAEEAKKKRDALLEEVKRHFGYTIDPKDEKFQLMLEQKEKEQKKQIKELKKKKREEFFMAKLAALESGQEAKSDQKQSKSSKNEKDEEDESDDEKN